MSTIKTDNIVNRTGDQDSGLDLGTNDVVKVKTANTERMRIDSTGRLMLGTTSAATATTHTTLASSENTTNVNSGAGAALSLKNTGTTNNNYSTIYFENSAGGIDSAIYGVHGDADGTGTNRVGTLVFATAKSGAGVAQRMRITSAGLVEMGVAYGYAKLAVDSGTTDGYAGYFHTNTAGGYAVMYLKTGSNVSGLMYFYRDSSAIGSITTNGSSTSFNTTSDYRLKENVVTDWDATSRLKQLKPSRFNFKADKDTTVDGFLAHEVSSIVPEAIIGKKDAVDKDGNIEPQGIDQSKLVPLLVKTIQELEARITALEAK